MHMKRYVTAATALNQKFRYYLSDNLKTKCKAEVYLSDLHH